MLSGPPKILLLATALGLQFCLLELRPTTGWSEWESEMHLT